MNDLISRQAAIDALGEEPIVWTRDDEYALGARTQWQIDNLVIETLPSAQQNRLERAVAGNSPEEIYDFLYWLMFDYARTFTDSRAAVIAWLKGESDDK